MAKLRIVVVIIRNNQGQYFVHQRRLDKESCPDGYALGIGGRIEQDEDIHTAAKRELKEESGIVKPVKFLFSLDMNYIGMDEIIHVFYLSNDAEIKNHDIEWQWSGWMTQKEVDELVENGKLCPDTAEYYTKYKSKYER
ncbi:MAG: NUDIX domain-containing protein [bacterium]|nr:NUDIX domain-containing protein [bacterium]